MATLRERSRPLERQTNGVAESIKHQVARHAVLILTELEERSGSMLDRDKNFLLWFPEYAAMVRNRFHRKEGHTPYYRVHGERISGWML